MDLSVAIVRVDCKEIPFPILYDSFGYRANLSCPKLTAQV